MISIKNGTVMIRIKRIAQKQRGIVRLNRPPLFLSGEAPRTAKIILHPGPADRRILPVPVDIKLHLTLSPPVTLQRRQRKIGPSISSRPFQVRDHKILLWRRQPVPSPLCVEILRYLRQIIIQTVIHLVKKCRYGIRMFAGERDARTAQKRHCKIAVQPARRHGHYRHGADQTFLSEPTAEKVPQRRLNRRLLLVVPVHPQNKIAEHKAVRVGSLRIHRHPDMAYHPGPLNIRQRNRRLRPDIPQTRTPLSRRPQMAGSHPAPSFFSRRVLRIYRPRPSTACKRQPV